MAVTVGRCQRKVHDLLRLMKRFERLNLLPHFKVASNHRSGKFDKRWEDAMNLNVN